MRALTKLALASASLTGLAAPAFAQDAQPQDTQANVPETTYADEAIIVQARRRDESIQDVPVVVQAVTAQQLDKLNIRDFKDVQTLVPGLNMSTTSNGIQSATTLRGVNYDVTASGNNGTVEFYLNDAPLSAGILFQSMFDIGQIEVLRGPQGTLRGRASPSGSITVTTRRPDLSQAGGYMEGTLTDLGGWNLRGAINVPVIGDRLAIRLAGIVEDNDGTEVRSINNRAQPFSTTEGLRASVLFEPLDMLTLFFAYTNTDRKALTYDQVESGNIADPTLPAGPVQIRASDRLGVMRAPRPTRQRFSIYNWQAELRLAGQKLNYVGSINNQIYDSVEPADKGAVYGPGFPDRIYSHGLTTLVDAKQENHEIRLSSDERIAGTFDYVVGYLWNKLGGPPTFVVNDTLVWLGPPQPDLSNLLAEVQTPIFRAVGSLEKSFFGNVTAHVTDTTEISGGIRRIKYHSESSLAQGCETCISLPTVEDRNLKATIYSASVKHRFNESLMTYASFGTSWRPGGSTNATLLRNMVFTPLLSSLLYPDPEKSKSYEIGIKTDLLDHRLRLNVSAYHQTFKNFQFFAREVFIGGDRADGTPDVVERLTGLAVGVPAKVDGVEAEAQFQATDRWSLGGVMAYAKSKVKNGVIPCNDFQPADGVPDSISTPPTFNQIMDVTGGTGVAFCSFTGPAGLAAPFSATLQSEYSHPLFSNADGYIRGFMTYYGKSKNDPTNAIDDISAYALVNLFAGVRDVDGGWEIGGYIKNVFDTGRTLIREASTTTVSIRTPAAALESSPYRVINYTAPREFGITARMSFGSR